jgi:hypothetical protein
MHYKLEKEIWNKMKIIYEGYGKVKKFKLQTLTTQFENIKMKEDVNIT